MGSFALGRSLHQYTNTRRLERWSNEEKVIALYFASRYISHAAVSSLLSRRGYWRTPPAVKYKVKNIIDGDPSLWSPEEQWNVNAVDQWMDMTLGSHQAVNQLIVFTAEDADIVAKYQSVEEILTSFHELEARRQIR
ncbi:hypothetical protein Asppvi_005859 [Aspergillus pseudoviridinutans]|uniref:Uncharacterized protein n=1 Tax=Aspergillus pseudoviridinutans TaxID=1517512 RepID=A0A9P3BA07_9EURO|nr:uncharacterized protein Asppvi_005859 [Aspergillus pseudoviridinutans]GIJ86960.1 hypothetical protein Asppvi_005859 [Aspergillus pseudoviridinutans]